MSDAAQVDAADGSIADRRIRRPGRAVSRGWRPAANRSGRIAIRANPFPIPVSHYKWLVFADPEWDWRPFDFNDRGGLRARTRRPKPRLAPILNATSPDLSAFRERGGKLLQYHGWNDQLISPQNSIDYYESVAAVLRHSAAVDVDGFYRLFMAPGMAHCGGGSGPNTLDMQAALEQWVERGVAPDQIIATRSIGGVVERSRPLCVYPKTAVWKRRHQRRVELRLPRSGARASLTRALPSMPSAPTDDAWRSQSATPPMTFGFGLGKWQVSTQGGGRAIWSLGGDELSIGTGTSGWSSLLSLEPEFKAGTPQLLFEALRPGRSRVLRRDA